MKLRRAVPRFVLAFLGLGIAAGAASFGAPILGDSGLGPPDLDERATSSPTVQAPAPGGSVGTPPERIAPGLRRFGAGAVVEQLAGELRALRIDDIFELQSVGSPEVSPDGEWVAYTVSQMRRDTDDSDTDIWMVSMDGSRTLRLTTSDESESSPSWSPDGRWLGFLSGRDGERTQVWLLPRAGGEAFRLTDFETGVSSFEWSPEGRRLALVVREPEDDEEEDEGEGPEAGGEGARDRRRGDDEEVPKPIVIDRLQFKRDGAGFLDDRNEHLHVFDVEARTSFQLTDGDRDERSPAWSPDGRWLAFVSNRTDEPDANDNTDIFLIEAREGATARQLTTWRGSDSQPAFSPDGRWIAYVQGGEPEDIWYATNHIGLISVEASSPSGSAATSSAGSQHDAGARGSAGGPRILTEGLDRNVGAPAFTRDGEAVLFELEERLVNHVARVPASGEGIERVVAGDRSVGSFDLGPNGELVVLASRPEYPAEVFKVEGGAAATDAGMNGGEGREGATGLVRLTRVNDDFLAGIRLGRVTRHQATSADGTVIDFFLTMPPDQPEGRNLPTLLRIHGGPVSQFMYRFSEEWQVLAAHGYAIVAANPRGSSGRGRDFSRAIWAAWGTVDFEDVMAAVDAAIEMGVADPERLGVGGWSYGGILTNYVIVQTDRFKAAISGASEVNYTANYGHDHYQRQWVAELGPPWENIDLWVELSPFFRLANVTTPTLVMCGQVDWNVPLQNSEQLYQVLRYRGVPTQLVVYPGQSHGIRRPSYQVDRYQRYVDWYDKWVKGGSS